VYINTKFDVGDKGFICWFNGTEVVILPAVVEKIVVTIPGEVSYVMKFLWATVSDHITMPDKEADVLYGSNHTFIRDIYRVHKWLDDVMAREVKEEDEKDPDDRLEPPAPVSHVVSDIIDEAAEILKKRQEDGYVDPAVGNEVAGPI